ncbi:MAG: GGDEF domain-containing protein [Gammaproteobacteria bacterium]|nr:MAG: GGDEF domain-containing protein [Gammaproteobacteria bacterium]
MYSYSQLLIRNTWLGLLFYISVTFIAIVLFLGFINEKQVVQSKTIAAVSKQVSSNSDTKQLVRVLKSTEQFILLDISSSSGEKLFHQEQTDKRSLLNFLMPEPATIQLKDPQLTLIFQLSYQQDTRLLIQLLLLFLVATIIFAIVAASLSVGHYKKFYSEIGQVIKRQLQQVGKNETNEEDDSIYNITELKEGIAEIKSLIKTQQSTSVALERQAFSDSLTGLNNRNKFVHFFENKVAQNGDVKFGVLLITRCSELQTINQIRGFSDGDRYIAQVSKIVQSTIPSHLGGEIFRMNSSDFAVVLPNVQLPEGEEFAEQLTGKFNEYQQASDLDSVAYTGLVTFTWQSPLGELLALADTGISVAQTQKINSWFAQKDSDVLKNSSASYGNQNWRQEIDNVIENNRVTLLVQPIQPNSRNSKVYGEILARFLNSNGDMLPTASFIAMAEKLDKIVAVDKLIIKTVIDEIKHKNLLDKSFGINISARSISDEHFLIWLERRLLKENQVASRLIFEITEYGLQQNIKSSKRFIDMIHRSGARITVERFGVGLTSFKFFRDLKPDFIKMDSTYTRDIDEDKNNQYFLRLMVDLAHRISINVLAESVETIEEKRTLEKLFIDGCQGYYISKPTSL